MSALFDALFSWATLWWILIILYIPVSLMLIVMVLLQQGKGAGFAGAFGLGGGSDTVFGPRGARTLPVKLTQVLAGAFMVIALFLSIVYGQVHKGSAPELAVASESMAAPAEGTAASADASAAPAAESVAAPATAETPAPPAGS